MKQTSCGTGWNSKLQSTKLTENGSLKRKKKQKQTKQHLTSK